MYAHILNLRRLATIVAFLAILSASAGLNTLAQMSPQVESASPSDWGPALVTSEMGAVFAIHQVNETLLVISSEKGLFRWNARLKGQPQIAALSASSQFEFVEMGDVLLIGTDAGLFRWNVRLQGSPELVDGSMGDIKFLRLDGVVLIGTKDGLFRWSQPLKDKPELVDGAIKDFRRFFESGELLLLGTSAVVYQWNTKLEGRPTAVPQLPRFRTIYAAGNKLLLGTLDGLVLWNDRFEGSPEVIYPEMGGIVKIHRVDDLILISADSGLYRWNDRLEGQPSLITSDLKQVLGFYQNGDTLLLGGDHGVYRWNVHLKGQPALIFSEGSEAVSFQRVGNAILIDCARGLYRWNEELKGKPEFLSQSLGEFSFTNQTGSTTLIGAMAGLFQWTDRIEGPPKEVITAIGPVRAFYQTGDRFLIGSDAGLFLWNTRLDGEPKRVTGSSFGPVHAIYQTGPTILVAEPVDMYRWSEKPERPPIIDGRVTAVSAIYQMDKTLLLGASRGLYRWDANLQGDPVQLDVAIGGISAIDRVGNTLLLAGGGGLFRWNDRLEGQPELVDRAVDNIHALQQAGNMLLVGGNRGLFRINGIGTVWNAETEVSISSGRKFVNDAITVTWRIRNYEQRANPSNVRARVSLRDHSGAVVTKDALGNSIAPEKLIAPQGEQQIILPTLAPGSYAVNVYSTDLIGNTSESEPVNFRVYASIEDYALDWGKYLAFLYAALTVLFFVTLVIGARWSRRCFDVLTDPVIRKLGIYFGLALRYVRPVRLWVFERYFDELKKDWSATTDYVSYHLVPVEGISADPIESTTIVGRLRNETRILILGGPGTGKSALVGNLMSTYCRESSLRAAWRKYGFIPVVVRLRELAGSQTVQVSELIGSALDGKGMTFNRADSFLESLLRNNDFLVILDGLNEVNVDEAVDAFAVTHSSVRLLATSQTDSLSLSFKRYALPFFDAAFVQVLLRKFVGDASADKAIKAVPELWNDIKCGYDVRLVEYLINSARENDLPALTSAADYTRLPKNRLELYRAMVNFSQSRYEQTAIQTKAFPEARICERAWNMWRNGQYLFQPDQSLSQQDVEHLVRTNLVFRRTQGYEFMHTLMRDFLGAEFCTRHSGTTKLMIQTRLLGAEAAKIWQLPPTDQAPVFSFLAQSIEKVNELERVFQFASAQVEERHQMMIAVQEAAQKKRWHIRVNIDA